MEEASPIFVGIDPTAGRFPFTFAAIDHACRLVALSAGEMDDAVTFLTSRQAVVVAVNAPPRPNQGLVRRRLGQENLASGRLRGSDMRQAEYELHERGISILPTPSRIEICPAWMQMGFDLYHRLEEAGFKPYPSEESTHQYIETHPHAAFCALLGQPPLPKPTLEGRLQRQIALYEQGLVINDPMGFFEEITRHKLLHGILPVELVYAPYELDTLVAAYLAYCVMSLPQSLVLIGDQEEGRIALPKTGSEE